MSAGSSVEIRFAAQETEKCVQELKLTFRTLITEFMLEFYIGLNLVDSPFVLLGHRQKNTVERVVHCHFLESSE